MTDFPGTSDAYIAYRAELGSSLLVKSRFSNPGDHADRCARRSDLETGNGRQGHSWVRNPTPPLHRACDAWLGGSRRASGAPRGRRIEGS
jgi:hypothetical protein